MTSPLSRTAVFLLALRCQACPVNSDDDRDDRDDRVVDDDDEPECATSCEEAGAACGVIEAGCPSCGDCGEGETCGAARPNQCAVGTCTPATCADLDAECGEVSDGCADVLACGACGEGETCGRPAPNRCGVSDCVPVLCTDAAAECGVIADGCGGTLSCGQCADGETCGGNGPNQCGVGVCDADSCIEQGAECGQLSDGCDDVLACGDCAEGETCGAGGLPNQCGVGDCVPRTCEEAGAVCGSFDDGCGVALACGTCPGDEVCGYDVDNQCAAVCAEDCPTGFTCDAAGVCDGESGIDLDLDLSTPAAVSISGRFSANGGLAIPMQPGFTTGCLYLTFTSLDGLDGTTTYACASDGFAYDVSVFAGRYTISAGADDTRVAVPRASQTVVRRLRLD